MPDPATIQQANGILAGVSAGFTGTILGHPLDLIKVRLQARSEYKGTIDCLSKTMKNDGLRGMFRGISSPLFGLTVLNAITFGSYTKLNSIQESLLVKYGLPPTLQVYNHFLSGAGVGIICGVFSCPFEVIKVRMQLDGKAAAAVRNITSLSGNMATAAEGRRYTGFFDCGNKIWQHEKMGGFYNGFVPTTIRDVSFCATYFAVYEVMKKFLQNQSIFHKKEGGGGGGGFSPIPIIISGGLSGAFAWVVSFPLDSVKTTMQDTPKMEFVKNNVNTNNNNNNITSNSGNNNVTRKAGMLSVAKTHYQKVGISGFYAGLTPAIFRAFLVSSVRFFTFESVLYFLNNKIKL